jgi:hypothetical protein
LSVQDLRKIIYVTFVALNYVTLCKVIRKSGIEKFRNVSKSYSFFFTRMASWDEVSQRKGLLFSGNAMLIRSNCTYTPVLLPTQLVIGVGPLPIESSLFRRHALEQLKQFGKSTWHLSNFGKTRKIGLQPFGKPTWQK